jgi:hypothetical protein
MAGKKRGTESDPGEEDGGLGAADDPKGPSQQHQTEARWQGLS